MTRLTPPRGRGSVSWFAGPGAWHGLPTGWLAMPVAWGAALCLTLAACSGSSGSSQPGGQHKSPASVPSVGPAAAAAVKSTWLEFFNGTVSIPKRLKLLQDPPAFTPFVHKEEKTSLLGLVLQATAKVSSVTVQPNGQAKVVFTILLGGKPLARNLHGTAVYTPAGWKVASATFCALLKQAYGKKTKNIPAACGG